MDHKPTGIGKIVYTEAQIRQRITEISTEINRDYRDKELVIVSVLKGSIYFVADLTRKLSMPLNMDFLSIGLSPEASGKPAIKIKKDLDLDLSGRHVLLVEDVIGTGFTLGYVCQHLEASQPASLKICTLLDNPADRLITIKIDYCCFTIPDSFLVGYGLDYRETFRNLPYIAEFHR
ncbi:MAG TPA: hypoxanthine phosphoribosyltransferase [Syntrophomonadaceae bacterium]|nr:hypoxanthine phosphoribosyltransferase [Syntrophomonadaceae bacterium]HNX29301.1 hypoxanthine phosphoribosyltransferase [Syntrophomonadaceae bacterium]HPR92997.1 hypoxanthine phosphoribosyltransferase [Syntrophomonadaceae bacterium]